MKWFVYLIWITPDIYISQQIVYHESFQIYVQYSVSAYNNDVDFYGTSPHYQGGSKGFTQTT